MSPLWTQLTNVGDGAPWPGCGGCSLAGVREPLARVPRLTEKERPEANVQHSGVSEAGLQLHKASLSFL